MVSRNSNVAPHFISMKPQKFHSRVFDIQLYNCTIFRQLVFINRKTLSSSHIIRVIFMCVLFIHKFTSLLLFKIQINCQLCQVRTPKDVARVHWTLYICSMITEPFTLHINVRFNWTRFFFILEKSWSIHNTFWEETVKLGVCI